MDITPAFVSRLVQQKQSWGSSKGKVERDACARRPCVIQPGLDGRSSYSSHPWLTTADSGDLAVRGIMEL